VWPCVEVAPAVSPPALLALILILAAVGAIALLRGARSWSFLPDNR
jgi:hypothetical protein